MGEPYDPSRLLRPGFLKNAVKWDDGRELAAKLIAATDPDVMADLIEEAVEDKDRCLVVLMALLFALHGRPEDVATYIETTR